jgi:hypothetical protein
MPAFPLDALLFRCEKMQIGHSRAPTLEIGILILLAYCSQVQVASAARGGNKPAVVSSRSAGGTESLLRIRHANEIDQRLSTATCPASVVSCVPSRKRSSECEDGCFGLIDD